MKHNLKGLWKLNRKCGYKAMDAYIENFIEELEQLLEETKNFTSKLSTQRTHAYNRGCYDMLKEFLGQ